MRGHTLCDLFKGWSSHLAYFHQDKITNYPKLKMWFKRMTYWVMKTQRVTGKLAPPPVAAQPTTVPSQSIVMTSPISDVCVRECDLPGEDLNISTPQSPISIAIALDSRPPSPIVLANSFDSTSSSPSSISEPTPPATLPSSHLDPVNTGTQREFLSQTSQSRLEIADLSPTLCMIEKLLLFQKFFAQGVEINEVATVLSSFQNRWQTALRLGECSYG